MDKDTIKKIQKEIKEKYDKRIENKGAGPEGLLWDSKESMEKRFEIATEMYDFTDKKVLDIGCGFGDFLTFLKEVNQRPREYHGIDVSEKAIEEARRRNPNCSFEKDNFLLWEEDENYDIAVIFGVLNDDLDCISNELYLREFMRKAFRISDNVLINVLSRYLEGDWGKDDYVYYYSPEKVFGYAQELTRNVRMRHDFEPIPQKEFNILLSSDN